jgi:predicted type IV restriction endonuclease
MLREELQKAIEQVKERIKKHGETYERNEAMVSRQLVDPILRALGWPTDDPDHVEYEQRTEDGKPDWTLKWDGKRLFVETKKMARDIMDSLILKKFEEYLSGAGVDYGVITNGQRWLLFTRLGSGKRTERTLWEVDILKDPFEKVYEDLETIARENADRIEDLIERRKKMEEVWERLFSEEKPDTDVVKALAKVMMDNLPEYHLEEEKMERFVETRIKDMVSDKPTLIPRGESKEEEKPNGEKLGKTRAGDWALRKDLGEGIFVHQKYPDKQIDVTKQGPEVESLLKSYGFEIEPTAYGSFYYTLRRRAHLIGKRG